jgi:hypothetical protein
VKRQGKTFRGGTEVLDGNTYHGCEFRGCTLVYRGGAPPELVQCHFAECRWEFADAAGRTLAFLKALRGGGLGLAALVDAALGVAAPVDQAARPQPGVPGLSRGQSPPASPHP